MSIYRINEIFASIQGEGFFVGTPTIFVRLSGCNLSCAFCDTDHSERMKISLEGVLNQIISVRRSNNWKTKRVCITGGEPSLQDLKSLTSKLLESGFEVSVETNGTNLLDLDPRVWIAVSPKENLKHTFGNELKVLVERASYPTDEQLEFYDSLEFEYKYLQPVDGFGLQENSVLAITIAGRLGWRVSGQLHKRLGVR